MANFQLIATNKLFSIVLDAQFLNLELFKKIFMMFTELRDDIIIRKDESELYNFLKSTKFMGELQNATSTIRNLEIFSNVDFKMLLLQKIDLEEMFDLIFMDIFISIKSDERDDEIKDSFLLDALNENCIEQMFTQTDPLYFSLTQILTSDQPSIVEDL